MKNIAARIALHILSALVLFAPFNIVNAQKPGLRAPINIKIDGKLTEWNNKLKEYSNHTQFYYAISNDDRYLYLTVQATDDFIINRILKGGITLTINKSGTKKDPDGIHISYPIVDYFKIHQKNAPQIKKGATAASVDSFVNVINTRLEQKLKMIRVIGIKNIDSLISIYNLDGIKAASQIDDKIHYNLEIAVSLKNLGLDINSPAKFMYQVMINEVAVTDLTPKNQKPGEIYVSITLPGQLATDFWGEYTLVR
ncbi:hypothetical protein [Mucilaginibacter sp. UR6-11]|uniref:hypothetical protein n=1 Tax=Mucilaginibacter sp. UR6-11 TaxID=1435644 RepID=UPI001E517011|nr:hypothetical protein [Mucilaginibacter sp. UR6-11]MCC8423367.1 hypothetical protein [Mucilaginibacter sp. UR6-11]